MYNHQSKQISDNSRTVLIILGVGVECLSISCPPPLALAPLIYDRETEHCGVRDELGRWREDSVSPAPDSLTLTTSPRSVTRRDLVQFSWRLFYFIDSVRNASVLRTSKVIYNKRQKLAMCGLVVFIIVFQKFYFFSTVRILKIEKINIYKI